MYNKLDKNYNLKGNSNFALPLIVLNSNKNRLIKICNVNNHRHYCNLVTNEDVDLI